jgi:DNA-binding MarR family transcriptional regulator
VDVGHLHSALIHVLRLLREVDAESGLSPSRLSALSVLVFVGAMSQAELARIEGVSAPSMSLLVRELEADGLVERAADPADARRTIVSASRTGRELMVRSQRKRLEWLSGAIDRLPADAQRAIGASVRHFDALIGALRDTSR